MIDALIQWSLRNRALVLALATAFLGWGGYVVSTIPVDVLPDLTAPTVTILVEGRGMAPTEMESLVTFPIEAALNGASGIRRVRSATAVGIAVIWAEFNWGEDIYGARQTVTEKLALVAGSLPPEVERPFLAPISSIMGEILFVAVESQAHSPLEVRTVADTVLRRRLLAIPGVSQVTPIGGGQKQYQVIVTAERLREYDVSLAELEEALREGNQNTSAGFRVAGGQEYLIQGIGRVQSEEEIGQMVVATRGTRPILVRDLASVTVGEAIKRGEGSHNGNPAVILGIQKQPNANTLELTRAIDAVLDDIQASADLESIRATLFDTPSNARVPLSAIADIREDRGSNFVTRENVQRKIVVMCNVAGRDLRSVVNDVREQVRIAVPLPQGYRVEYGGQFESEAAASNLLLWLGLAVVLGILVILTTAFRSLADALIIMCNLPLALIGGVAGVFLSGGILSVASMIGFITLFGIAARNGIMLVSHIKHVQREEGITDLRKAILRGASERLTPILMTALCAGLALIPVALGAGKAGSEIQSPMAMVILFGLLSSTVLNMVVVPAVYFRFRQKLGSSH